MLLAIDLGNTNMVLGVYDGGRLTHSWRLSASRERTVDELGILLRSLFALDRLNVADVDRVIVSSVVPPMDPVLIRMCQTYLDMEPVFVTWENAGVPVLYDDPAEVGADRIVNAVAALDRYAPPAVIVDCGTATTFDAITAAGEYLGGLISPGIEVSARALVERAAKLPRIELRKPGRLVGRSTAESLQSGFFWGYISLVDGVIERIKAELGENAVVIATGGMAHFLEGESRWIQATEPNLTLDGLYLVARRLGLT